MGFCAFIGGGVSELTFVEHKTGGTTIDVPALAQEGDLAVLMQRSGGNPAFSYPSGFSSIQEQSLGDTFRVATSWKVLEAGDVGATLSGMGGTSPRKMILVFRPDDEIENVSVSAVNAAASLSAQSVMASGGDTPLVVIGAMSSGGTLLTISSAPAFDEAFKYLPDPLGWSPLMGYKIYNGSPADHSISGSPSGSSSDGLQSFYISVS